MFSTKDGSWVVKTNNELFNENGKVNVELSGRIDPEYTSLRMSSWYQYYEDVLDMYNDHENSKIDKIVDEYILDKEYSYMKKQDTNNFFVKYNGNNGFVFAVNVTGYLTR